MGTADVPDNQGFILTAQETDRESAFRRTPHSKQELAELMTSCGIKPTARAEELTLDDFSELTDAVSDYNKNGL